MSDPQLPPTVDEKYVLQKFESKIGYYWASSKNNKKLYKRYRTWSVILGALVTLVSSISAAEWIQSDERLRITFAIATPILAATLTVLAGLGQNFHWGAAWRDMVVNATRLELERDRFMANPQTRDCQQALETLNGLVLEETQSFFQRILDSEIKSKDSKDSKYSKIKE